MWFLEFINGKSVGIYMFIFFGKMFEVALATLRVVLISRGERGKGTALSIVEIVVWVLVTGTVLNGFTSDIVKVIVFCFAFGIGVYLGSFTEAKLALGLATMQVIAPDPESATPVANHLRENGLAVTVMAGEGRDGADRRILIVYLKRNKIGRTVKLIRSMDSRCVIAVTDLKVIHGGFIRK